MTIWVALENGAIRYLGIVRSSICTLVYQGYFISVLYVFNTILNMCQFSLLFNIFYQASWNVYQSDCTNNYFFLTAELKEITSSLSCVLQNKRLKFSRSGSFVGGITTYIYTDIYTSHKLKTNSLKTFVP